MVTRRVRFPPTFLTQLNTITMENKDALPSWLINNLAVKFSEVLHDWLTEDEMKEVTNDELITDVDDFCDANMAMDAAWNQMFILEMDLSSDADIDLWNSAWSLAVSKKFNITK